MLSFVRLQDKNRGGGPGLLNITTSNAKSNTTICSVAYSNSAKGGFSFGQIGVMDRDGTSIVAANESIAESIFERHGFPVSYPLSKSDLQVVAEHIRRCLPDAHIVVYGSPGCGVSQAARACDGSSKVFWEGL